MKEYVASHDQHLTESDKDNGIDYYQQWVQDI